MDLCKLKTKERRAIEMMWLSVSIFPILVGSLSVVERFSSRRDKIECLVMSRTPRNFCFIAFYCDTCC